ncbi:hypothetical protein DL95DRAFT_312677, partial [Leptodontidium sp. 2 PMI_412]
QNENQVNSNFRGNFYTDSNKKYAFYYIRLTLYLILYNGFTGKLLQLLDRYSYRFAHIY